MDSLDIKQSSAAKAGDAGARASVSQGTESQVALNVHATASYLGMLSRERGMLSEGLERAMTAIQNSLTNYLNNPKAAASAAADPSSTGTNAYAKLSSELINRDADLQEKVAQDLSTAKKLVRSRDAAETLQRDLAALPPALREGTAAGRAVSHFIAESLVNLTDRDALGAGLERDLAVRNIYAPKQDLSSRSRQATSRALSSTIAYVESNQPATLKSLAEASAPSAPERASAGSTTPQAMTHYLRAALNEFPEDHTYLDIFKQNRAKSQGEPSDKVSKEISGRIHSLITKAAETARAGNLLPGQGSRRATPAATQPSASNTSSAAPATTGTTSTAGSSAGAGKDLSLAELSARAQQLQVQFREERQRLAAEGRTPQEMDRAAAARSSGASGGGTGSGGGVTLNALSNATISFSYNATQLSTLDGGLGNVPGSAIPVSGFTRLADEGQNNKIFNPRSMSEVLAQGEGRGQQAQQAQAQQTQQAPAQPAQQAPAQQAPAAATATPAQPAAAATAQG
ncbi:MAG: hypothetical protein K6A65_09550, partial [Succinivibrionaceae bacterium]|nr:hypothetical protein [Succinivibrionaceae bacterium]